MSAHATDPRVGMGYEVEPAVYGPFGVKAARASDSGGTLDRGIVARTESGRKVVIGEIWARCPGESPDGVRIDADAVARSLIARLNAFDEMLEALEEAFDELASTFHALDDETQQIYGPMRSPVMGRISAAIAKATGVDS